MRLPCMAVQQPNATLLVDGVKDVENRNSAMPSTLIGQWCAVYASKTLAPVGSWIEAAWRCHDYQWPWPHGQQAARKECVRGAVVGLVRWYCSTRLYRSGDKRSPWAQPGAHHWTYSERIVLQDPVPLVDGGKQSVPFYLDEQTTLEVIASAADERLVAAA